MLSLHNFSLEIAGKIICQKFSVDFPAATCVAILGSNGIGKSTMLATLSGLANEESNYSGQIFWQQREISTIKIKEMAKLRGYLAQNRGSFSFSTVSEYCLIGRHPHLGAWQVEDQLDQEIVNQALAQVNLLDKSNYSAASLSGGEQQRLAIATLLAQQPQCYMLDEPLLHLDLPNQIAILQLFKKISTAGHLVIMVLHDPSLAWQFCQHCLLLSSEGAVFGESAAILNQENLSKIYNYPIKQLQYAEQLYFVPEL